MQTRSDYFSVLDSDNFDASALKPHLSSPESTFTKESYLRLVMDPLGTPNDSEELSAMPTIPNSTSELIFAALGNSSVTESPDGSNNTSLSISGPISYAVGSSLLILITILRSLVVPFILFMLMNDLWERYCVGLRDRTSDLPLPNGRMGVPVFGEMFHFLWRGVNFQRGRRREFGPIYRTHLFGSPTITVTSEKYVKKILLGEGQFVETKWPYTTRMILGTDGIVNGTKETHVRIKRLALRAFSPRFMETYAPTVQRSVKNHVAKWKREGEVHILEECRQLVTRTMMDVLMGIKQDDPDMQKYISAADDIINSILCLPLETPFSALRRGKRAREFIFNQMEAKLKSKMECSDEELFGEPGFSASSATCRRRNVDEIAASGSRKDSVLVNIIKLARLEGEKNIKLKNLQNLSLEFIFAGTQSLQCSSSLMVIHLSQHPEVLHLLRKEITENGLWDVPLDEIPYKRINSLKYTSHVVNEVLRVTPPIPGAIRVAKKTFELGGYQVPKGWQVIYSIRETHEIAAGQDKQISGPHIEFSPSYFACEDCKPVLHRKQPDVVEKPSFIQQKEEKVTSCEDDVYRAATVENQHVCHNKNGTFSFIPFGKGSRMCAGVNYALFVLRVLAIEIARSSDFELISKAKLVSIPMTKPAPSVRILFKPMTK